MVRTVRYHHPLQLESVLCTRKSPSREAEMDIRVVAFTNRHRKGAKTHYLSTGLNDHLEAQTLSLATISHHRQV